MMRTLAQKMAEYALKKIQEYYNNIQDDAKKEFKSFTAGAPSMILQNGFGQTMAFWLAKDGYNKQKQQKKNSKYWQLFEIIRQWLCLNEGDIHNNFVNSKNETDFMEKLFKMSQQQYLMAHNETLALLEWVKRFASALAPAD